MHKVYIQKQLFIFPVKETALVLLPLSFMWFATHELHMDLMSMRSKEQSSGEFIGRKMFMSSAKRR
jgi:hypothetical protein